MKNLGPETGNKMLGLMRIRLGYFTTLWRSKNFFQTLPVWLMPEKNINSCLLVLYCQ